MIGMTIVGWAVYGRLTRAEMLSFRERDFIVGRPRSATRTGGHVKHALPNVVQPALVFSMSDIVLNLMTLAALSYLGLGVQPPTPSLDRSSRTARIISSPHGGSRRCPASCSC